MGERRNPLPHLFLRRDMKVSDSLLLDMEVKSVLNTHFTHVYDSGKYYNFRCNVCGDSKTDKKKKRAYILRTKEPMTYYCHNCQISTTVDKWMREHFPFNYKNYVRELMKNRDADKPEKKKEIDYSNIKKRRQQKVKGNTEKKYTRFFKPITKYPHAVKICEDRMIPKSVYEKWFYCTNDKHKDNKYRDRIIITFRNEDDKIYYYQGRAIHHWQIPKYKSRIGDYNNIYNYYNVDKEKPVVVIEGPIDSAFVTPSIAVTGLKIGDERLDDFKHKYFLLDNDKDAKRNSIKLLLNGNYIFNWSSFLQHHKCDVPIKDVNDFILHNKEGIKRLTFTMLEPYFTKDLYDKIYFI
jgi:hypothetical protein